jgi:hypothetical protein
VKRLRRHKMKASLFNGYSADLRDAAGTGSVRGQATQFRSGL